MTRKIARYCDIAMELGWLLSLVTIPLYFNIYTSRVFEPDKITILRSLVMVMAGAWLIKGAALWLGDRTTLVQARVSKNRNGREKEPTELFHPDDDFVPVDTRPSFLDRFFRRPLMLPTLFLCLVYLLATILSVVPGISWWGSYQRLQGTYTFYTYVTLFLILLFNLKERRQIERIITFVLLVNVPITLYGILQHNNADPLPWQGDTTNRVTSSMGNAIFISAYLIMCIPLALYRGITTGVWLWSNRTMARRSTAGRNLDTALSWVLIYGFFTIVELGLFYFLLQFNANYHPDQSVAQAASTTGNGLVNNTQQAAQTTGGQIGPWWALPLGIIISFGLYFIFTVRRQGTDTNYLFRSIEFIGYATIVILQILVIVFSQSRGPEAGLLIGIFLMMPLIFWRRKMWKSLGTWLGVGFVVGGFLVLFNLPPGSTPLEPVFKAVRSVPDLERLSELTQLNDGSGEVRKLIWQGDIDIIKDTAQSDPLRLLIGFGPESLYQISPLHYQPELAHVEARNAIPDRSHNGYLDAIMTTGFIGLIAYVLFVIVFIFYAVRYMFKTNRLEYQVLLAALVGVMVSHQIEIQVGIQIVSTWTMFWVSTAILVLLTGLIRGSWERTSVVAKVETPKVAEPVVEKEPELEPVAVGATASANGSANSSKGKAKSKNGKPAKQPIVAVASTESKASNNGNSGKVKANGSVSSSRDRERPVTRAGGGRVVAGSGGAGLLDFGGGGIYPVSFPEMNVKPIFWAILGIVVAFILWWDYMANFIPIQADALYKVGQNYSQAQKDDQALPYYLEASQLEPNEDYYRLYLGEVYLEKAQADINQPSKSGEMEQFFEDSEQQLVKAHELAPLNADHLANLGRLYAAWAQALPAKRGDYLNQSINWYKQALVRAPYNARLYSELSQTYLSNNDTKDAIAIGEKSVQTDNQYDFGRVLLGNAYLAANNQADAAKQYEAAVSITPNSINQDGNPQNYLNRLQLMATNQAVSTTALVKDFTPGKTASSDDRVFDNNSLGIIYFYKADYTQAENLLTQVLSASQGQNSNATYTFYAHLYLAQVYAATNRQQQAQTEAQTAYSMVSSGANGAQVLLPLAQQVLQQVHASPPPSTAPTTTTTNGSSTGK